MKNRQNNDRITFSNYLVSLIEGLFIGFANGLPFFQCDDLKETMGLSNPEKEKEIQKKNILTSGMKGSNAFMGFLSMLLHKWVYILGAIIGFVLFFFIPVWQLKSQYPLAYYGSSVLLCFGFLIYEAYRFFTDKKEKKHFGISILVFILSFIACYLLLHFFYEQKEVLPDGFQGYLFFLLAFLIGSFLSSYGGVSLTTLFILIGSYLPLCNMLKTFLYAKEGLIYVLCALIGALIGLTLSFFLKRKVLLNDEKRSFRMALYLSAILYLSINHIKEPFISDVSTTMASWFTTGSVLFVSLLMPVALTMHGYRFLKDKDEVKR